MTTQFNSFDASPLGAFVESPLGARNKPSALPLVVAIAWLDESTSTLDFPGAYNGPGGIELWNRDRAEWLSLRDTFDPNSFTAAVFDAPTDPSDPQDDQILPDSATIPEGITLVNVPRTPSAPGIVTLVRNLIPPGRRPSVVAFAVDESGSMRFAMIAHIFPHFWSLLETEFGQRPIERSISSFADELWLRALSRLVRDLVQARA